MLGQKAIIVDDEKHARESLCTLLQMYCPTVEILADISNVTEAKTAIKELQPDIVFLDIAIGQYNGFDFIKTLSPIAFHLIFTTAYSEFALKAFQAKAIDYLLKPIDPTLLKSALDKVNRQNTRAHLHLQQFFQSLNTQKVNKIAISTLDGIQYLELDKISHIIGSGNYSTFYLLDGSKIMASKSLKYFEGKLPDNIFYRSHQSHLVNLHYIKSIQASKGIILLHDETEISLSKSKKDHLIQAMKINFEFGTSIKEV